MGWIDRLREKRANRQNHIALFERLQKQNERWWIAFPAALFFSLTLLPIKSDTFGTIKLIVSIASAVLYCLTKVIVYRRRAPLTRWRHISTAAFVIGFVNIGSGLGRLIGGALLDRIGRAPFMVGTACLSIAGALIMLAAQVAGSIAVQVAGKLKGTVVVPMDSSEETIVAEAMKLDKVAKAAEGFNLFKTILVKNKLVNLIVKPKK